MGATTTEGTGHGSAEGPVRGLGPVHKILKKTEDLPAFTLENNDLIIRSDCFPSDGTEGQVLQISDGQISWNTLQGNDITLNIQEPENSITLTVEDNNVVLCDASSSPFTVTLPVAADSTGKMFRIKKIDASANAVSVTGSEDDDALIDGGVFAVIEDQWECITITSNGTDWYIL